MNLRLVAVAGIFLAVGCNAEPEADIGEEGAAARTSSSGAETGATSPGESIAARPVLIGKDGPDMDACGTVSIVASALGEGNATAPVHAAPDAKSEQTGTLAAGHMVVVCDGSDDGAWQGIVYDLQQSYNPDCGTGSPVAEEKPYPGTCASGWMKADRLEMLAG